MLAPFWHLVETVEVDGELEGEPGDLVVPEDAEEAIQPGRPGGVVFWAVLTFRSQIKMCLFGGGDSTFVPVTLKTDSNIRPEVYQGWGSNHCFCVPELLLKGAVKLVY